MNENFIASLFDSSDDDALSRTIDRFADGECSVEEEAKLFDRLDATPGAWRQCALALVEARDLRGALAGAGRSRQSEIGSLAHDVSSPAGASDRVMLASQHESTTSRRRQIAPWSAVALAVVLAFATGFAVAPREKDDAPSLANRDATPIEADGPGDRSVPDGNIESAVATAGEENDAESSADGPEILNVVYRPSDDAQGTSAPLPVYKSDEDWARVLDDAVRKSDADLAERRVQLLAQGADVESQIVLHPVTTEDGEMLLPVETFQIVPLSLSSFH